MEDFYKDPAIDDMYKNDIPPDIPEIGNVKSNLKKSQFFLKHAKSSEIKELWL